MNKAKVLCVLRTSRCPRTKMFEIRCCKNDVVVNKNEKSEHNIGKDNWRAHIFNGERVASEKEKWVLGE